MKKIQIVPSTAEMDSSHVLEILSNPKRMETVYDCNRHYYHWDEMRYRVDTDWLESTWIVMKRIRESFSSRLSVCGLDMIYNIQPDIQEYLHHIDRESAKMMGIDEYNENKLRFYSTSTFMEEAIASSQMEGAATTRKDAKKMLRTQRKPRDTSERMIFNNYVAMELIKEILDRKMDIETILDMHATITKDTLSEGTQWEGRFREDDETVVGSTDIEDIVYHIPPRHERIPELVQDICDFINDDDVYIHPIVKGIIIHYLIGYVHPFVNGNGRLARSLFYWYVMKKGYWLMKYTSISRIIKDCQSRYGLAYQYTETDDNDLTYFIRFNLDCIEKGVDALREYIERKTVKQEEMIDSIETHSELNIHEIAIMNDYGRNRTLFSIGEISERYGITYHTARNYINHLCESGLIKKISKDGRTCLFIVSSSDSKKKGDDQDINR